MRDIWLVVKHDIDRTLRQRSFWIVTLGMVGAVVGLVIWRPGMGDFPVYTQFTTASGPLWPMLFVTIACGAISGWHSLVSTSGTARQLERETDALPVGGGAMFLEAGFAVIAFLTATVAFGGFQGYMDAGGPAAALGVFAQGFAAFLGRVGIPQDFGVAYGSVFLTIMAITIMQLVVRFMRVASAELVGDAIPVMKNVHVGTTVALLLTVLFVWIIPWLAIWGAFGASNQLMAGLALMLIALWLKSESRKNAWALYPAIFMIITTLAALIYLGYDNFFRKLPAATTVQATIAFAHRVGADFPELMDVDRRGDLRDIVNSIRLDLLVAKADETGGDKGIRYLIDHEIAERVILERLGIDQAKLDAVKAEIAAELAEVARVKGFLKAVEGQADDARARHLIDKDVADESIVAIAGIGQDVIDTVKLAMEQELAEKARLAAEAEAAKKAAAEGPKLDDISSEDMLRYIEDIREIMEFSDNPDEIRTMCEQSSIPKSLVEVVVDNPDKLDELEAAAEA